MTETKRLQLLLSELITHPAVQCIPPPVFSTPLAVRCSSYWLNDLPTNAARLTYVTSLPYPCGGVTVMILLL